MLDFNKKYKEKKGMVLKKDDVGVTGFRDGAVIGSLRKQ